MNFHTSRFNYKDESQEATTNLIQLYSSYGELIKEILEDVGDLPYMLCKVELQDRDELNAL